MILSTTVQKFYIFSLEIRVRALNTELSTYKRTVGVGGYSTRNNRGRSAAQNISRSRDSSRESNRRISRHRANLTPSSSREPSRERKRPPIYSRGTASSNARIGIENFSKGRVLGSKMTRNHKFLLDPLQNKKSIAMWFSTIGRVTW